jgi:trk system potassium uptake protein TrkH
MTYTVLRILMYVLGIVGTALLLPLSVAYLKGESAMIPVFLLPMVFAWLSSLLFFVKARGKPKIVGIQDAFGIVGGLWIAICIFGSLPLYFSGCFASYTDALFESVSGFTTTGATVLSDVESLPSSINVWRCTTHWLGGLGVVALAVAMIPLLGAGGFRLIKAETTGPDKGKFTASIASTAKILWFVYFGLTALQTLLLWCCGLGFIDSLTHAFSTLGTGGFSTRNASIGAFGIPAVEWICTVFMLLSSVSFLLYCRLLTGRTWDVLKNSELKMFFGVVAVAVLSIFTFEAANTAPGMNLFRDVSFQVASVISTTGFMTYDYTRMLPASQIIIIALFFTGGCSGSTSGGIKIVRWTVLSKQLANEIRKLIHPYGVFSLRLNGIAARDTVVTSVAAFIFAFLLLVLLSTVFGALAGLDVGTAFTAGLSMMGNVGPAFGSLGPSGNYGDIPAMLKLWYMFAMLAGRLEIYTLLILLGCFTRSRDK